MSSSSRPTEGRAGGGASVATALATARRRLEAAGVDAAEAEAGWILHHVTGLRPGEQVLARGRRLDGDELEALEAALRRREAREPLAYVIGSTEFYGLPLEVRPGVLVPRPETERLVELVLEDVAADPPLRLLEIGTGTGAIVLAVAHARATRRASRPGTRAAARPHDARPHDHVAATDLDPAALELARRNAERLGLQVELHRSDLLAAEPVRRLAERADVLVANLPYLPDADRAAAPPELAWEPAGALFAGSDGLAVARRLLDQAREVVRPDALLWLELDPRNVLSLAAEASLHGWHDGRVRRDLTGRERFLRLRRSSRADEGS